jgi:hypothetical protein
MARQEFTVPFTAHKHFYKTTSFLALPILFECIDSAFESAAGKSNEKAKRDLKTVMAYMFEQFPTSHQFLALRFLHQRRRGRSGCQADAIHRHDLQSRCRVGFSHVVIALRVP